MVQLANSVLQPVLDPLLPLVAFGTAELIVNCSSGFQNDSFLHRSQMICQVP